ncbi:unnamed protein product [Urochloa humidicola]
MAASAASSIAMTSSSLAVVLLCATAAAAFFSIADARTTIAADGDLVVKTCADVMSHDWGWSSRSDGEKYCVSTLRLHKKRSAAAKHPRDLALIAMDLAQRAVADADAKVAAALRSGAAHRINGTAALTLRHCRLDYAAVASTIPVCRAMIHGYNRQQHVPSNNEYFECARRLRRDTWDCLFSVFMLEDDVSKLVVEEVQEAWLRVDLVDGMLEEMLGVVINDHDPLLWSYGFSLLG